jgi:WD40 repeat protein
MLTDIVEIGFLYLVKIISSKHPLRRYYGQNLGFEYGNSTAHFERYENCHTSNAWSCMLGNEGRQILIILSCRIGHKGWVLYIAWAPDGKTLASGSMDNTVRLWDPKTGKALGDGLKGHTKWITCLSWEPYHL